MPGQLSLLPILQYVHIFGIWCLTRTSLRCREWLCNKSKQMLLENILGIVVVSVRDVNTGFYASLVSMQIEDQGNPFMNVVEFFLSQEYAMNCSLHPKGVCSLQFYVCQFLWIWLLIETYYMTLFASSRSIWESYSGWSWLCVATLMNFVWRHSVQLLFVYIPSLYIFSYVQLSIGPKKYSPLHELKLQIVLWIPAD